jgi:serine/threonine protein kinase
VIRTESCPNCLRKVDVSAFGVGSTVRCPYCNREFDLRASVETGPGKSPARKLGQGLVGRRLQVTGYDRFKLVGKGAMGRVYEAFQVSLKRKVALKVLDPELGARPGFEERFQREASTGGKISHRNVVRVFDLVKGLEYTDDGPPTDVHIIAMEFVDGPHLRQIMDKEKLPEHLDQAAAYFRQICEGVGAAHQTGIVHRDLKPENIMLHIESGQLKVADFGLAYFVERDPADNAWDTRTRMTMGTVAYMPPEQRKDAKRVVASGDVFSLGRILYEMFVGSLPDGSYTPPSEANPVLPEAFDEVISKALKQKPEARYQDALELLVAFEEAMAVSAVSAERSESVEEPTDLNPPSLEPALQSLEPTLTSIPPVEQTPPPNRAIGSADAPPSSPPPLGLPVMPMVVGAVLFGLILGWLVFSGGGADSAGLSAQTPVVRVSDGVAKPFEPIAILRHHGVAEGGIWGEAGQLLVHRARVGGDTLVQARPATAEGSSLQGGNLSLERRFEWAADGDPAVRTKVSTPVDHLVGVGYRVAGEAYYVAIDGAGRCVAVEAGVRRACNFRPVRTPARLRLSQVGGHVEATLDGEPLPLQLKLPKGEATALFLCQNQKCSFDPTPR